jgi:hypothetical protein
MVLWPRHIRAARLCMPGARHWAAAHGIDWSAFVRSGLRVDEMSDDIRNDPFMARAIAELEKENG